MPASMTGFGDASADRDGWTVTAEIRAVNNRHLKLSVRLPDGLSGLEAEIEKRVKAVVARGSVNVSIRCDSDAASSGHAIDRDRLKAFWDEWRAVRDELGLPELADGGRLLGLPGVMLTGGEAPPDAASIGPTVLETLATALQVFEKFRRDEGAAMAADLQTQAAVLDEQRRAVAEESPQVVTRYRDRLKERLSALLADTEADVADEAVAREAALFADKADVNEEVVRLGSHLEQLETFLASDEAIGRKLDFLTQEINREVNTIGSKANDAGLARRVVAMKAAVEKIREILQNIE